MKARVFQHEKNFNKESNRLANQGLIRKPKIIDDYNKCYPLFEDTNEKMPSWSGYMYAEYYYNRDNELVDVIAYW